MLGADTFVTKPLSPGFFRYLWQYHLQRDPEWYAGVDLNLRPRRRRRRRASRPAIRPESLRAPPSPWRSPTST